MSFIEYLRSPAEVAYDRTKQAIQNLTKSREFEELFELRLVLECHATRVAATKMTAEQLAELRTLFDRLKAKHIEDHISEFSALDAQFHSTIYRAAANSRFEEILLNRKDQIVWVRAVTATFPGRVLESLLELDKVLDAMERRDSDVAEAAMARHIGNIAKTLKSMHSDEPSIADPRPPA